VFGHYSEAVSTRVEVRYKLFVNESEDSAQPLLAVYYLTDDILLANIKSLAKKDEWNWQTTNNGVDKVRPGTSLPH